MESEPDGPSPGGDDELSRQREKRTTALLARCVPGFSGLTFGQTLAGVVLAAEQAPGTLDVERFLAGEGHDRRTIESILAYLGPGALRHPSRQTDEALEAMTGTGTVLELPVRRSCIADADTFGEPDAVPTDGESGGDLTRLQLLRRLQAMLLPE
jgi:hypothetical protein